MKTNRLKKTSRRNVLVTVWTHPDSYQSLVQPGTKRETRRVSRESFFGDNKPLKMVGKEEYWSNEEINNLAEYEG